MRRTNDSRFWNFALVLLIMAGLLTACAACNGPGVAPMAPLTRGLVVPMGLGLDKYGNLYVAEAGADRVSMVTPQGERRVFTEGIPEPVGLVVDRRGHVLVASSSLGRIYGVAPGGEMSVLAQGLDRPEGLALDDQGRLLVAETGAGRVLRIDQGRVTVLAQGLCEPRSVQMLGHDLVVVCADGIRTGVCGGEDEKCFLRWPAFGLARTPDGEVCGADLLSGHLCRLRGDGRVKMGLRGFRDVTGMVCDRDGGLFVATYQGGIYKVPGLNQ